MIIGYFNLSFSRVLIFLVTLLCDCLGNGGKIGFCFLIFLVRVLVLELAISCLVKWSFYSLDYHD